jgi:excisionase family DNA binding protein
MQFDVSTGGQSFAGGGTPQGSLEAETLLTVQEVAALLKVPVSWVYEHTRQECDDPLPAVKVGKYLRFFKRDINDHLEMIRLKNHRHR